MVTKDADITLSDLYLKGFSTSLHSMAIVLLLYSCNAISWTFFLQHKNSSPQTVITILTFCSCHFLLILLVHSPPHQSATNICKKTILSLRYRRCDNNWNQWRLDEAPMNWQPFLIPYRGIYIWWYGSQLSWSIFQLHCIPADRDSGWGAWGGNVWKTPVILCGCSGMTGTCQKRKGNTAGMAEETVKEGENKRMI